MKILFENIADLRKVLPQVHASASEADIFPYLEQAAIEYMHPFISEDLYDDLQTALEAANWLITALTVEEQAIITHLRRCEAHYGFYRALPTMLATVGSGGFQEPNSQNAQGARQWVHRENKANYIATADLFLDKVLQILEADQASYTVWTDSPQFSINSAHLLASVGDFVGIGNSRRTFLKLRNYIKMAEDRYVVPAISRQLLAALITKKQAATAYTAEETILVDYLYQAISAYALFMGAPELMLDISAEGIRVVSTSDGITSKTTTDRQLYNDWMKRTEGNARHYLAMAKMYLDDNVAAFADYTVEAQEKPAGNAYASDAVSGTSGSIMI
jgi:hypothetical protein